MNFEDFRRLATDNSSREFDDRFEVSVEFAQKIIALADGAEEAAQIVDVDSLDRALSDLGYF